MPSTETKHDKFLRLMEARLWRALEELRLVSQLASPNYEYQPEEAEEALRLLDEATRDIANKFSIEYATRLGKAAANTTNGARPLGPTIRKTSVLDEITTIKTLELLRAKEYEEVDRILRSAIVGKAA